MSVFAKVALEVVVELETDPGINTPDAYEPPYDYLAIREVSSSAVEFTGDSTDAVLLEQGGSEDLDPDGLLTEAVRSALLTSSDLPSTNR